MNYSKPPLEPRAHIELLKERGLVIQNEDRLIKYITTVGYYRLSGYMFPHQEKPTDKFKPGTTTDLIVRTYNFDKALRFIILEYLERIEIALRALLVNVSAENNLSYSTQNPFYWYLNDANFRQDHHRYLDEARESIKKYTNHNPPLFVKSFLSKYNEEQDLPCNMAFELLTFGRLSKLYSSTSNNLKNQSSSDTFGLPAQILETWFARLTVVRNICAHHSRFWNYRIIAEQPRLPQRKKYKFTGKAPPDITETAFGTICIIDKLLSTFNPTNSFTTKIYKLLGNYNEINPHDMGFPEEWTKSGYITKKPEQ